MAFVQRQITTTFSMGQGAGGGSSATVSGLRTSCQIGKWGGASMGTLELAIWGMDLSTMNTLSTVGTQYQFVGSNSVTVMAGDEDSGMSTVFQGTITKAWVDARSMPQVAFRVSAQAGGLQAAQPAQPTSIQGGADAATIMQNLASQMGLQFEGNNVSVQLSNPYFWGDLRTQAMEVAEAAGIEWIIDNGTLAIWQPGSARQSGSTPLISPQTGLVGYPAFDSACVVVTTLFNPSILPGGSIQVQSDLTPACGTWNVLSIDLDLECLVPHGSWFETITASSPQAGGGGSEGGSDGGDVAND